ncbi:hypothetical protein SERLADRAFT_416630 [Serpula lacrymans var. lacrymans S7.9]|uniref:Uncharacterized protein n=1 Tax=Serpula lacrymans var. lacrymans (strain S7.9) TaxID=578457 RepID=F8P246_SERL9|nr:uncharacterized protein SERLADRAFT_416630 [Serpula lacrymans var. lacrymans S7.9]EGO23224.1 hypothetical protein SERLADRAFT_416630 [Serpula lacrymans var. lacrymans S7.9]
MRLSRDELEQLQTRMAQRDMATLSPSSTSSLPDYPTSSTNDGFVHYSYGYPSRDRDEWAQTITPQLPRTNSQGGPSPSGSRLQPSTSILTGDTKQVPPQALPIANIGQLPAPVLSNGNSRHRTMAKKKRYPSLKPC